MRKTLASRLYRREQRRGFPGEANVIAEMFALWFAAPGMWFQIFCFENSNQVFQLQRQGIHG